MLDVRCKDYFEAVRIAAADLGEEVLADLEEKLHYLASYANGPGCMYDQALGKNTRCCLYPDSARLSFEFVMYHSVDAPARGHNSRDVMEYRELGGDWERWFNGGLIAHGEGAATRWSTHT